MPEPIRAGEAPSDNVTNLDDVRAKVESRRKEEEKHGGGGDGGGGVDRLFVQKCLDANELGDGTLFAELNRGEFAYCHDTDEWLMWTGHSWTLDRKKRSRRACERVALRYEQERQDLLSEIRELQVLEDKGPHIKRLRDRCDAIKRRVKRLRARAGRINCLEFAATCEAPVDVLSKQLDANPYLLAVANGVVDLRSGELRDGRPGDWLVRSSPIAYDPHADTSVVTDFMWSVYEDEEKIAFVQRLCGIALIGEMVESIMPIFWGQGRNGKDTFFDMVKYVLGDLGGDIQPEMLLDQGKFTKSASAPSPDIMALKGMRVAVGAETGKGASFNVEKVKWLTGSTHLVGRHPHDKHNTRFPVTHTLFLMTNEKPQAGNDYAFWKRVYLIDHPYSFVDDPKAPSERQRDKDMGKKLAAAAPAFLLWMVEGALAYLEVGVRPPASVMMSTQNYQREGDVLSEFLAERCYVSSDFSGAFPLLDEGCFVDVRPADMPTLFSDIYDSFDAWYRDTQGDKVWAKKTLGMALKKHFECTTSGDKKYFGVRPR